MDSDNRLNPGVVHFDDSLTHVVKINGLARNIGVIAFPYETDEYSNLPVRDDKIYIPDMVIFEHMVAQCHCISLSFNVN
jgi:hypothetical protein